MGEFKMREIRREQRPPAVFPQSERREDQHWREVLQGVSDARGDVVGQQGGFLVGPETRYPAGVEGLGP